MRPSMSRVRRGLNDLGQARYSHETPLVDARLLVMGTRIPPAEVAPPPDSAAGWMPAPVGTYWGGQDATAWYRATASVPSTWHAMPGDRYAPVLRLILGYGRDDAFGWPEGLLYVNGQLRQGINRHHPDVILHTDDAQAEQVHVDVRAWSGMTLMTHRIEQASIALLDHEAEQFYFLLESGANLVDLLPESAPVTHALARVLNEAYDAILPYHDAGFAGRVSQALAGLRKQLSELREAYDPASRPVVTAVGHGHLDVAWLWQTRHTREKTARTFSIATELMDLYPDYVFLHTTPQVYAWLKRDYPDIYERTRRRVAEGRFEAAGALWLETDCTLVSGEALVRQILYGERFLREEFGTSYDALWLPDAFGYSAALPQIMMRSGIPVFMTTKLSWSETNRIPMDTFRWRGLDGSDVIAHFITTPTLHGSDLLKRMDTYNGEMSVQAVMGLWEHYRQKDHVSEVLLSYGHGDGGAGPTRQDIECAHAIQQLPALPEVRLGRADTYFRRLLERIAQVPDLPVWDGELYLEYHQGTFTSQAWLKRAHRQSEARLLMAEFLDAWQWVNQRGAAPDRKAFLDDAWRTLLLHEFHDILPGSSIGAVYEDARAALADLTERLDVAITDAVTGIDTAARTPYAGDTHEHSHVLLNPAPHTRDALVKLPAPEAGQAYTIATESDWQALPVQVMDTEPDGDADTVIVAVPDMPGWGFRRLAIRPKKEAVPAVQHEPVRLHGNVLENAYVRVVFADSGEIVSLLDKRVEGQRELVLPGQTLNRLEAFDDRPADFDAWNIDTTFERKRFPVETVRVEAVERGPLRATMRVERRVLSSCVTQDISLTALSAQVDFATTIDWHDHHVLLKAAFPLDLRTRTATSDIQYGAIERSTHRNTSWDQAQFETVAHKWVDLSEAGYGVALLNDGRYGHDVYASTMRISLLRSPTEPDPHADQGIHSVTYSLYPHLGDWRAGGVVAAGYAVNRPVRYFPVMPVEAVAGVTSSDWLFRTDHDAAVIETVKRSVQGDRLIVRVYEAHGGRRRPTVTCSRKIVAVEECDLLERPLRADTSPAYEAWLSSPVASHDAPETSERQWSFQLRPYEVRTFAVRLGT